ncbi:MULTISPECIES: hypothetical protein [unclassified Actinotalea]|uniref:hypothetical protein n=1 Tax=unclassified Actinotalea TaxID=2638618 RepID=UPI0015F76AC6|nr:MULTISPECIES: hypothetical protein [unclassified Actinotalea]
MSRRTRGAALVTGALLLAGCATPLPEPQPDAVPAVLPPAVSQEQVEDVMDEVAAVLAEADAATEASLLDARLFGPAREIRGVEYALARAGDPSALTPIPAVAQTIVAPTTDTWPRTVMAVTEAPADLQAPLLLTLVQETPRTPYRLWAWVRLFPGVEMPATARPEVGSAPVANDADTVAVPPADVVARYVDLLTNGDASPYAAEFTPDPLRAGIIATRDAFAGVVGANGTLTETYAPLDSGPYSIETADGGAIVVGGFRTVTTITLADSTLTIGDQTAALLGKPTVANNLAISWLSVVAFAVPPAGSSEPITVLGGEHSRIQVTGE